MGNGKTKKKDLSPQDAALLIQLNYRAHLAHRSQVTHLLASPTSMGNAGSSTSESAVRTDFDRIISWVIELGPFTHDKNAKMVMVGAGWQTRSEVVCQDKVLRDP
ncbi:hypothetical protein E2562_022383 [Oryza meyeriana var. granulata]|uniref:Uncharacterized protein n=1 Tax=Oryza meyeriana var. granulata TaxID=110450 RepID=A0A6G1EYA2_9ORYZ|nr:hypothetical protein E2562_022383 [Oryza meyeriana var. granulata]